MDWRDPIRPTLGKDGRLRAGRGLLLVLALLGLGFPPGMAAAQTAPVIQSLQVDLWPEYDRPSVLVIYWIQLADATLLPATVRVPIPAAVGEPFAVGMGQAGGLPLQAQYTRQVDGDWASIVFETESLSAQVEFYADLTIDGDRRQYTFTWPAGVALGSLSYVIQKPIGAADLTVTPPGSLSVGNDGMSYLRADLGPLDASATATVTLAYTKTTAGLSIEALQPSAPLGASGPAAGSAGLGNWLPWIAGGLAVVLLAGVGTWYWRIWMKGSSAKPRARRIRPSARRTRGEIPEADASPMYCHSCGAQAGVSDRFCRRCGTRLRR